MSGAGPRPDQPQPDWYQIADAVWLAAHTTAGIDESATGRWLGDGTASGTRGAIGPVPTAASEALPGPVRRSPAPADAEPAGRDPLGTLPAGRQLARALNALKLRVRSATEIEPDAESTAEYAADAGIWLPRYRPVSERRLGLTIIVDDSPAMAVWRPTVTAFRLLLERHGAFRSVRTFRLSGGAGSPPRLRALDGGNRSPAELLDSTGRQLFMVVTDGRGPMWSDPATGELLRLWGSHGPLTLVNPFPQRHWRRGNLHPRRCRLRAPRTAAPTCELQVRYPPELSNPFDPPVSGDALAVPLVELSPRWLRWWAGLMTGPPGWLDATVHVVGQTTPPDPEDLDEEVEPAQAVLTFRRSASPQAFRLATLVAAAPLRLPLLHRLRHTLLPGSEPHHLAEVLASGLVRATNEDGTAFEFPAGVREALLSVASREDTARVLRTVLAWAPPSLAPVLHTVRHALSGTNARWFDELVDAFERRTEAPAQPDDEPLDLEEILASPEPAPMVWGNVPARNPDFTGRRAPLERLERALRTQHVAVVLPRALDGEGGVGKSQIAVEYAYRHRDDYEVVWWVPAGHPAQILASLIELGERLGLDVGNEVVTAVPKVRAALRAGTPYRNWLLIFDNAETPETVRDFFPDAGSGKVLITSHNHEWSQIAESVEVDVFTRAESVRLLRRRNRDLPGAERLAAALGDLPLAIEHASAWLHATGMPVDDYLRLLAEKNGTPVAAAAGVALDRLAEQNPAARQLLQVCSFFAPEPISRELLVGVRGATGMTELDEVLRNPNRLNQAIRDLQRYVLVRVDHRGNTLHLHRLVRSALQDTIGPDQRPILEHGAHLLLTGFALGDPGDSERWLRYQAVASHVVASNAWACEDDWARDIVINLLRFYYYWGDYNSGNDLARRVVADWRARLGPGHPQSLSAAKLLGYYCWVRGDFDEAARIQRETLDRYLATVGPEDEGTINAMNMVASTLRVSGRFTAARDLDLDAFHTARQFLGEDDPVTLVAAHNLATSLRLTGEFRAARKLDADTYRRRMAVLGQDHPETLRTLNNLSIDERECGEYIRSRRLAEENYHRYVRLFGVAHQETISIARNLAVARRRAGDYEGAYKLAEDTMNRFRDRFGSAQPDAIAAALDFAVDLRESDDLERARDLAEQIAQEYRETLGADHPYTLYARSNLAIVLRLLGRPDEAERHSRAAWETLTQLLGTRHVLAVTCGINLASDLAALGRHPEAHDLDTEMLDLCGQLIGVSHPTTLACALNLSFDLRALGRSAQSSELFAETLEKYRLALGAEHPAVQAALAGQRTNCDADPMQF